MYCRYAAPFTCPNDSTTVAWCWVIAPALHCSSPDTWVSTFLVSTHVAFSDNDVVLMCNVANSPLAYILRRCLASRWY